MDLKKVLPVAFLIGLSALVVSVYALIPGVAPNPGHTMESVAPPASCTAGQILKWSDPNGICTAESGAPILSAMGWERRSQTVSSSGGGISCSAGKRVMGGGCYCTAYHGDPAYADIAGSYPNSATSWRCEAGSDCIRMEVYILCANY